MGWIICRASVRVVGLSVRAGHSSGVVPFPGVEDDSLPGRCPAAESRVSLSEVELSWSTAQAALKAAASSSMGTSDRVGSGAGGEPRGGPRAQPGAMRGL